MEMPDNERRYDDGHSLSSLLYAHAHPSTRGPNTAAADDWVNFRGNNSNDYDNDNDNDNNNSMYY
jgi:hypothetical protein